MIVFTVYVPVNSGLRFVRQQGLEALGALNETQKIIEVRGEQITKLVTNSSFPALGITGQDLAARCSLVQNLGLWRTGQYERSLFGLPALCVLSKKGQSIAEIRNCASRFTERHVRTRIKKIPFYPIGKTIYTAKYRSLIKQIYGKLPAKWISMEGKADVTGAANASVDYVIDIVLSGKTAERVGLGVEAVLFLSDGVIVGNQYAQELIRTRKTTKRLNKPSGGLTTWQNFRQ